MTDNVDALFPAHVAEVCRRTDAALLAGGCDGLVAYSGRPRYAFQDDRPYPFMVNPHFKHWVPVTDAPDCFVAYTPGRRPRLCFFQPADYWHLPPQLPAGDWQREFDIHVVRDVFLAGGSEYEAHMAYCQAAGVREEELPYGNIIAYDAGGAVLHYQALDRRRDVPRRSFLIDAGAQFRGYAADITRTWPGRDAEFAGLVSAMDDLQQELCAGVVPGRDYRDLHLEAHRRIGALLADAGIVRCDAATAVAERVTSVFFPHGIGHLLGLQVHDVAGLAADAAGSAEIPRPDGHPFLRLTRTLGPGFVVTIEPGIYFIDLLLEQARADGRGRHIAWDVVERLKPFGGIRIEDDVACAAAAPENLTRAAFAAVA